MNPKTPIIYGCMIALSGTILMLSLNGLGLLGPNAISMDREMIGGTILFLMIYLFLLFGIYLVLKKYKQTHGNSLSFKNGMIQGMLMSLSAACCSVLFTILFYEFLYPDYVSELLEALKEKMELNNVSPEKIAEKIEEKKKYYRTSTQSIYSFTGNLITGFAFTLLLSFFLKSKA